MPLLFINFNRILTDRVAMNEITLIDFVFNDIVRQANEAVKKKDSEKEEKHAETNS